MGGFFFVPLQPVRVTRNLSLRARPEFDQGSAKTSKNLDKASPNFGLKKFVSTLLFLFFVFATLFVLYCISL